MDANLVWREFVSTSKYPNSKSMSKSKSPKENYVIEAAVVEEEALLKCGTDSPLFYPRFLLQVAYLN